MQTHLTLLSCVVAGFVYYVIQRNLADHEHMNDLKHTIHVKEVNEAPAHEPHVLELHR